jgi:ComF family protein
MAIHTFKYNNQKVLAATLAAMLAQAYKRYNLAADVIVPVPLHRSRFRERGYNQSELLARQLGTILTLPVNTSSLKRIRKTQSQMSLGAGDRKINVNGAFACHDESLANLKVLLIDDVCTTGSTLDSCAAGLRQVGVASVWGLTLAKPVDP